MSEQYILLSYQYLYQIIQYHSEQLTVTIKLSTLVLLPVMLVLVILSTPVTRLRCSPCSVLVVVVWL